MPFDSGQWQGGHDELDPENHPTLVIAVAVLATALAAALLPRHQSPPIGFPSRCREEATGTASRRRKKPTDGLPFPCRCLRRQFLRPEIQPIDLDTALRLAGVQNPELNVARQRVLEAVAVRQLAAARFLPSINPGNEL